MAQEKARVLIVGAGGVGIMAAYALQTGGKAKVTAVMRSNYEAVLKNGIDIDSIEHGFGIKGWRIANVRNAVPSVVEEKLPPFDFILVTTKNIPEIPPSIADLISPAVTPGHTAIVLSQNGINVERAILPRFPTNPIISSTSYIGATERSHGNILHDDIDAQKIGPFPNQEVPFDVAASAARRYIDIYNASGKLQIAYIEDVRMIRWRKLIYNASYNSVAAILRMDTPRMRMSRHVIDDLIRPVMLEIMAAASACGVSEFPADLPEEMIRADSTTTAFKPSMCQDIEKRNFMEIENIVGEPLREGEARGVPMPTLRTIYGLLKALQLQVKEEKGMWTAKFESDNPYQ